MKKRHFVIMIIALICAGIGSFLILLGTENESKESFNEIIKLPEPRYDIETSIEKALLKRRSIRTYKNEPLTLVEVSQLLWAAQGITDSRRGFRTAPSAGA